MSPAATFKKRNDTDPWGASQTSRIMATIDEDMTVDGSSTTCSSPVLYRGTEPQELSEAHERAECTQSNFSQLEALAELDSMLEHTSAHPIPLPLAAVSKIPTVTGKRKRGLPELLTAFTHADRQSYSSLSSLFEVSELRLLLQASGFPVNSSTTKANCIEKLIKLHHEGSLKALLVLKPPNPPASIVKGSGAGEYQPPAQPPTSSEGVHWSSSAEHWRPLQDGKSKSGISANSMFVHHTSYLVQVLCRTYWNKQVCRETTAHPTMTLLQRVRLIGSPVEAVRVHTPAVVRHYCTDKWRPLHLFLV